MRKYKYKVLKEYFNKVVYHKGFAIYDVLHSEERYKERVKLDIEIYKKLLENSIEWIIKNNKSNIEDSYIFISKKYGFGVQINWRKDLKTKKFNGYTATTLSEKEMKFVKREDKKIILEKVKKKYKNRFEEGVYTGIRFKESIQKELDLCGTMIFIEDKKLYVTREIIFI